MLNMEQVYTIMHYLNDSHVDRIYPVNVAQLNSFQGDSKIMELNNNSFVGINEVQLLVRILKSEDDLSEDESVDLNVSCAFCIDDEGNVPIYEFESLPITFHYDKPSLVSFKIDWNAQMLRESHLLTGVKTLKFGFDQSVHRCFVHSVIFRSSDYRYTLEDLEQAYFDGENYVRDKLNDSKIARGIMDIPEELERYVYMCAGAYAWLIVWEIEAKPMKEPKSESNNYADRLFGAVDKAIQAYLLTYSNDPNVDYIKPFKPNHTHVQWGVKF